MTTAADAQLRLLMDEREISRTLVRFARCLDTRDYDGYAQLYTEDGELVIPWGSHQGRAGLAEKVRRDLGTYLALQHVSTGHDIHIDGDRATVRAALLATHVMSDEGERFWTAGGYYDMELVREGEGWKFRSVRINPVWRFETPSSEDVESPSAG